MKTAGAPTLAFRSSPPSAMSSAPAARLSWSRMSYGLATKAVLRGPPIADAASELAGRQRVLGKPAPAATLTSTPSRPRTNRRSTRMQPGRQERVRVNVYRPVVRDATLIEKSLKPAGLVRVE